MINPTDQELHDYIKHQVNGENFKLAPLDSYNSNLKIVYGLWHKICDPVYVHIFRQTFPVKSKVLQALCHD
jgi:hypothetical protein